MASGYKNTGIADEEAYEYAEWAVGDHIARAVDLLHDAGCTDPKTQRAIILLQMNEWFKGV